jgi:hypothetical protein
MSTPSPELPPKEKGLNPLTGKYSTAPKSPGRPKGAVAKKQSWKVEDRLKYKHKRNPLDELIGLADALRLNGQYKEAAAIWREIQTYCEPSKKPVETKEEVKTPEGSKAAAAKTLDLLKELQEEADANAGTESSSNTGSVVSGGPEVQA